MALGRTSLAILDLTEAARQPMVDPASGCTLVYNGEIYNYLELKTELQARGHTFVTHSDTEVIIHGYEEWGTRVVEHLRGMFAIALWDTAQQRLRLARDRFGGKTLV